MNTPLRKSGKGKGTLRTTPYGNRRSSSGCFAPFKSPLTSKSSTKLLAPSTDKENVVGTPPTHDNVPSEDEQKLGQEVEALKKQIAEKDEEIAKLSKSVEEEHIDKLHQYNKLKDIAQMVMGQLAEIEGTTTKEMYQRFELSLED